MAKIFDPEIIVLWYSKFSAMKKLLFLISLCFLNHSFAQPYMPIVSSDHAWSIDVRDGFVGAVSTVQITLGAEVIINSNTYTEVLYNGTHQGCYLREENGELYAYEDSVGDILILDMNLEIDDTFAPPSHCIVISGNFFLFDLLVVDVYMDNIAGEDRKVIELETPLGVPEYWIEGIGSTSAIGTGLYEFDNVTFLACYKDNGVITYFNGASSCDNTTLNLPEYLRDDIVLAPNPVTDVSILKLPSELNIDTIRILDITGRMVSEEKITKDHITINAMEYASGLYFFQALSENNVIKTERFVIR